MINSSLLHGKRVRLTALEEDDLATMATWSLDAGYLRNLGAEPAVPQRIDELKKKWETSTESANGWLFAIRPLTEETLLGFIEIDGILWVHRTAWIAIGIGEPRHRGKGKGKEALSLAIDFAFQELNLHRLQLTVFAYNHGAIRLYESLGFVREGSYRQFLERDGKRHDMILYGLLRPEWK